MFAQGVARGTSQGVAKGWPRGSQEVARGWPRGSQRVARELPRGGQRRHGVAKGQRGSQGVARCGQGAGIATQNITETKKVVCRQLFCL